MGKSGHITEDCRSGDANNKKKDETSTVMMIRVQEGTLVAEASKRKSRKWILNLGGTRHMSNQRENFSEFTGANACIMVGNQKVMRLEESGTIGIMTAVEGVSKRLTFLDVLYVPDFL